MVGWNEATLEQLRFSRVQIRSSLHMVGGLGNDLGKSSQGKGTRCSRAHYQTP
jgi:hypothetical protein